MWLLSKSNKIKVMADRIKLLEEENQKLQSDLHSLTGYIKGVESTLELFYKSQTTHNHNHHLMFSNDKNTNTNITDSTLNNNGVTNFGETNGNITQHKS